MTYFKISFNYQVCKILNLNTCGFQVFFERAININLGYVLSEN